MVRPRGWSLALVALLAPPGAAQEEALPGTLAGDWRAEVVYEGERGEFAVRLDPDPDGGLTATLSLPTIDAWDVATVPMVVEGRRLRLGTLEWTVEGDTISGVLPGAFVPVHRIPFTLHQVSSPERPTPATVEAPGVEPVWVVELGAPAWAGLVCDAEKVFVGTDAGELVALDQESGEEWWRFATRGALRARPTLADGTLYVHSDDGWLYALDAREGEERWRGQLCDQETSRVPPGEAGSRYDHYASSPALAAGRLFVGTSDGKVRALDAVSGRPLWSFAAADTVSSSPAVAGGRVIFGSFDGSVYALAAESGDLVWRYETGAPVPSSPLVDSGRVILGSRSYDFLALDLAEGRPLWSHYCWYSWIESSAAGRDGVAYVGPSDAQQVLAVAEADGSLRWKFDSGGSVWSQPAVTEDFVYVASVGVADYLVDHQATAVALDRQSGKARWQFPRTRQGPQHLWGFGSSPALGKDLVYFAGLDGRVYAFPSK